MRGSYARHVVDQDLRALEARWRRTRAVDDEAAWLRARARAGVLDPGRCTLAAVLGHEAALRAIGVADVKALHRRERVRPGAPEWSTALEREFLPLSYTLTSGLLVAGDDGMVRCALACARLALRAWDFDAPAVVGDAVDAVRSLVRAVERRVAGEDVTDELEALLERVSAAREEHEESQLFHEVAGVAWDSGSIASSSEPASDAGAERSLDHALRAAGDLFGDLPWLQMAREIDDARLRGATRAFRALREEVAPWALGLDALPATDDGVDMLVREARRAGTPPPRRLELIRHPDPRVRAATIAPRALPAEHLALLATDAHEAVRRAVVDLAPPGSLPEEALVRLARDASSGVRRRVAERRDLSGPGLEALSDDEDPYVRERVASYAGAPPALLARLAPGFPAAIVTNRTSPAEALRAALSPYLAGPLSFPRKKELEALVERARSHPNLPVDVREGLKRALGH